MKIKTKISHNRTRTIKLLKKIIDKSQLLRFREYRTIHLINL